MKSDTSAWMPEGQNCCSRSSPNVRNAPRSRAPPTHRSLNGAPPSPTRAWPQPSSTDSRSTPTSSTPAPTPTDSVPPEQRTETPPSKKAPSPTPPQRDRRGGTPKKTRPWVGPTQTITTGPNGLVILSGAITIFVANVPANPCTGGNGFPFGAIAASRSQTNDFGTAPLVAINRHLPASRSPD